MGCVCPGSTEPREWWCCFLEGSVAGGGGREAAVAVLGKMFLTGVNLAKAKSKYILVRMLSEAGTGCSFNIVRPRLHDKLTLLHYDRFVKQRVLFKEHKKIRSV